MRAAPPSPVPDLLPGRPGEPDRGSYCMDGLREFLDTVRSHRLVPGHLRGLFHVAIGRRITKTDGTVVGTGVTWRELSILLKQIRFDPQAVTEIGLDPDQLSPRDRQRFWYAAIAQARPDSPEALAQAAVLAERVKPLGYMIGPPPAAAAPPKPPPAPPPPAEPKGKPKKDEAEKPKRKKK